MESHRFFATFQVEDYLDMHPSRVVLDEEESHHATRVMRLKAGDMISLVNGEGWIAHSRILQADDRKCMVEVIQMEAGKDRLPAEIHIAIAPPKNMARLEWFLEKATEIGISQISPLNCHHSERVHLNTKRLEKLIRSALKQSLRTFLPILSPIQSFEAFITQSNSDILLMAYLDPKSSMPIKDVYSPRENVTILIGPEGDFSPEEVRLAQATGYQLVSLGRSRLRTETAALMACAVVNMINGRL